MQQFDQDPESYINKVGATPGAGSSPGSQAPGDQGEAKAQPRALKREHYLVKALGLDGRIKLPEPLKETPVTDKDPVCGVKLGEDVVRGLAYKTPYKGKLYFFCSDECKQAFDRDPESYVGKLAASPTPPPPPGTSRRPRFPARPPWPLWTRETRRAPRTPEPNHPGRRRSGTPEQKRDPVCGKDLGQGSDHGLTIKTDYQGKTYYFCSAM